MQNIQRAGSNDYIMKSKGAKECNANITASSYMPGCCARTLRFLEHVTSCNVLMVGQLSKFMNPNEVQFAI